MRSIKYRQWILEERVYRYRRKRKHRHNNGATKNFSFFDATGSVRSFYTNLIQQLDKSSFICNDYAARMVYVPEEFSFKKNYDETIMFFKKLISSYFLYKGSIVISFEKCKVPTMAAFSMLAIILGNIEEIQCKYNFGKHIQCCKKVKVLRSPNNVKTN